MYFSASSPQYIHGGPNKYSYQGRIQSGRQRTTLPRRTRTRNRRRLRRRCHSRQEFIQMLTFINKRRLTVIKLVRNTINDYFQIHIQQEAGPVIGRRRVGGVSIDQRD